MKISKPTMSILKNFASINPSLLFTPREGANGPGTEISTVSPQISVFAVAQVPEVFTKPFAIYDLNKVISMLSSFSDPEIEFGEKQAIFGQGKSRFSVNYAEPAALEYMNKRLKDFVSPIQFALSSEQIGELKKAASIMSVSDLVFEGDGSNISATVLDQKNPSSDKYSIDSVGTTDKTFKTYFQIANLRLIDGNYDVSIAEKKVSVFKLTTPEEGTAYKCFVAIEANSTYSA